MAVALPARDYQVARLLGGEQTNRGTLGLSERGAAWYVGKSSVKLRLASSRQRGEEASDAATPAA